MDKIIDIIYTWRQYFILCFIIELSKMWTEIFAFKFKWVKKDFHRDTYEALATVSNWIWCHEGCQITIKFCIVIVTVTFKIKIVSYRSKLWEELIDYKNWYVIGNSLMCYCILINMTMLFCKFLSCYKLHSEKLGWKDFPANKSSKVLDPFMVHLFLCILHSKITNLKQFIV